MRILNFLLIPQKSDGLKMGKSSLPLSHIYDYVFGYFFWVSMIGVLGYFGQFRQYVILVFFYLSTVCMVFWWF